MPKNYSIVGQNFVQAEQFLMELQPGTPALLVREPDNPFDPMAVAVWIGDRKIGFVPRTQNKVLAQFIDEHGRTESQPGKLALDSEPKLCRTLPGTFIRSPNSGFPMIQVE